ncbi:hypothetical protein FR483_n691R [Paramecium bursaria Chlorella virus FR483]|uniref:Uncharacterized protein n691R n=1 Tax=Paramecium bursaria Chlorella virus FR483 TaxID=399781 RepID=A7J845_PBCVF|nr:hypothetical protein FR483_n691R [Paramecium bursaria Chlorella virus FR483]ABT15976.1 hypothetical protein FR483_n691R [Paramecium bursaria Chlorella virus FR483]
MGPPVSCWWWSRLCMAQWVLGFWRGWQSSHMRQRSIRKTRAHSSYVEDWSNRKVKGHFHSCSQRSHLLWSVPCKHQTNSRMLC